EYQLTRRRIARYDIRSAGCSVTLSVSPKTADFRSWAILRAPDKRVHDLIARETDRVEGERCSWTTSVCARLRARRIGQRIEAGGGRRLAFLTQENQRLLAVQTERHEKSTRVGEAAGVVRLNGCQWRRIRIIEVHGDLF